MTIFLLLMKRTCYLITTTETHKRVWLETQRSPCHSSSLVRETKGIPRYIIGEEPTIQENTTICSSTSPTSPIETIAPLFNFIFNLETALESKNMAHLCGRHQKIKKVSSAKSRWDISNTSKESSRTLNLFNKPYSMALESIWLKIQNLSSNQFLVPCRRIISTKFLEFFKSCLAIRIFICRFAWSSNFYLLAFPVFDCINYIGCLSFFCVILTVTLHPV